MHRSGRNYISPFRLWLMRLHFFLTDTTSAIFISKSNRKMRCSENICRRYRRIIKPACLCRPGFIPQILNPTLPFLTRSVCRKRHSAGQNGHFHLSYSTSKERFISSSQFHLLPANCFNKRCLTAYLGYYEMNISISHSEYYHFDSR